MKSDNTLARYRNAIFHTSFIIDYETNLDERKIIFDDFGKKRELGIKDFINTYFKLIQFVQTFRYAITYSVPLDERIDGQKQYFDLLEDLKQKINLLEGTKK